jgi:hypothetical protein
MRNRNTFALKALLIVLLVAVTIGGLHAAQKREKLEPWEKFDFSKQEATVDKLSLLSLEELKLARGIVFGKHGRVFDEKFIQDWLKSRPWYKPSAKYKVTDLNDTERKNMDNIKEAEWHQHHTVEPGDLKFYKDKVIKPSELGAHTGTEWRIMRAEIEAIHGKRFDNEPELQAFFDERYWYKPSKSYDPKQLTEIDRKNIAVIEAAHKKQRNVAISPRGMEYFRDKRITEKMLEGLGLNELRILRNEVYARRGKSFKSGWLADYFGEEPWYTPKKDFSEDQLSDTEVRNVATIVKVERKLHEALSTTVVNAKLLDGLDLEDVKTLRLEIFARRGRVYKSKFLDGYFKGFDWYKPDPNFKETALSNIEKKNVKILLAQQKKLSEEIKTSAA